MHVGIKIETRLQNKVSLGPVTSGWTRLVFSRSDKASASIVMPARRGPHEKTAAVRQSAWQCFHNFAAPRTSHCALKPLPPKATCRIHFARAHRFTSTPLEARRGRAARQSLCIALNLLDAPRS